jgi:hypothetical protein
MQLAKTLTVIGNNSDEYSDYRPYYHRTGSRSLFIITRCDEAKHTYIFQGILMEISIFFIIIFMQ